MHIIINVEVFVVQYHIFVGRFRHASRSQTCLAGHDSHSIPGHFDYITNSGKTNIQKIYVFTKKGILSRQKVNKLVRDGT